MWCSKPLGPLKNLAPPSSGFVALAPHTLQLISVAFPESKTTVGKFACSTAYDCFGVVVVSELLGASLAWLVVVAVTELAGAPYERTLSSSLFEKRLQRDCKRVSATCQEPKFREKRLVS